MFGKALVVLLVALVAVVGAGCGEDRPIANPADFSPDQYELARDIGYEACSEPWDPARAKADPVGYAEEEFGGPGEFDSAREAGCLEALRR